MFHRNTVLAALLLGSMAAAAQAAPLLHTEVEVERAFVQQRDDVHVRVTLTNNGTEAAQILKWQTPFWGVDDDMFQVGRNGEAVAYLGRHVKRSAPTEADFVTLAPGQSLSARVEMSALYDMSRSGEYTFQYAMSLQGLRASAVEVASNVASLYMENDGPSPFANRVDAADSDKALTPVYKNCSASRKKRTTSGAPMCATTTESRGCRSSRRCIDSGPVKSLPTGPEPACTRTGTPVSSSAPHTSSSNGSSRWNSPTT